MFSVTFEMYKSPFGLLAFLASLAFNYPTAQHSCRKQQRIRNIALTGVSNVEGSGWTIFSHESFLKKEQWCIFDASFCARLAAIMAYLTVCVSFCSFFFPPFFKYEFFCTLFIVVEHLQNVYFISIFTLYIHTHIKSGMS